MGINTSKIMSVDLAIVKGLRLQQIVSGIFTDDETGITQAIDNNADGQLYVMINSFINVREKQKNKIIIWCIFRQSYEIIAKICEKILPKDKTYTFLTGMQDYDEKNANMERFETDPNCVIMIANQGAGGTGCNMVAANKVIYYSRDFSLEKDMQSDARNHRGGQKRPCERYDFVREGTIDAEAFKALAKKRKMSKDILDLQTKSIFHDMDLKGLFL